MILGSASTICAPSSPVAAPGGIVDIVARLIDQWLSQRLGQQFVIENRTGASGDMATEFVANLVSSSSNTPRSGQGDPGGWPHAGVRPVVTASIFLCRYTTLARPMSASGQKRTSVDPGGRGYTSFTVRFSIAGAFQPPPYCAEHLNTAFSSSAPMRIPPGYTGGKGCLIPRSAIGRPHGVRRIFPAVVPFTTDIGIDPVGAEG